MVEHVGPRRDHFLDRAVLAQEIRREHLDGGCRTARADGADDAGKVGGAAVVEIVAIDRGHDDVLEAKLFRRLGHALWLARVERARQAGLDVAEGAGARASVAHQHESGVLLVPALADIGAARLLADRVQTVRPHDRARLLVALGDRGLDPDPVGFFRHRRVRPMRLLRMARSVAGVENDGHGGSATYLRRRRSRRKPHHRCSRGGWVAPESFAYPRAVPSIAANYPAAPQRTTCGGGDTQL